MKAIINGKIVLKNRIIENGVIFFDKLIHIIEADAEAKGCEIYDAKGNYVIPGLVDIHIHGYKGDDSSDSDPDAVKRISENLTENGVTSWCPTTMTVSKEEIEAALNNIRDAKVRVKGAKVLGANVEGPFINPLKKGAQSEEHILKPDAQFVLENKDIIKLVTVAPEMEGGVDFIKRVTIDSDVTVSIGHTASDYKCAIDAINNGARHITHMFNAMPPLSHREVGVIGAALEEDAVSCELIADTFHINPSLFKMLTRTKKDKLILVTDCMRAGGLGDGNYTLGGQEVKVSGIECRLNDTTIAGSILTLNKGVYNVFKYGDIPLWEAVNMASLYPAKVVGEDGRIGSIETGKYADLVICDEQMNVVDTFVNGVKM